MSMEKAQQVVEEFEAIIESAIEQKYALYSPELREVLHKTRSVWQWNLRRFLDAYSQGDVYPIERLDKLIYQLFDIKLQLYYIMEVDLGLYNQLVYNLGYDRNNPFALPHVLLTRLSLDQTLIAKSRILWERIMNFVYFLEQGNELEKKVSGNKSKRKVFFDFVRSNPRWRFLEPYEGVLGRYDGAYRTPEFHKASVLRAELFGNRSIDPNELLELVNRSMIVIWNNILSIVGGCKVEHFTDLHRTPEGGIDPRYLE
ncbi:MAG: hypothetical protein KIT87_25665 [Anaerolineae bacterium]|nr:hypothetical protein [Anaerolineae bacterium]